MKVRVGTTQISYAVKATDTQADVANGLNAAFANAGLALQATDTGTGVQDRDERVRPRPPSSTSPGTAAATSRTPASTSPGTINGVAATGSGQQLIVPFSDTTISGLALKITGTTLGDLGTFTYTPGHRATRADRGRDATDLISGYITSSENNFKAQIKFINDQIATWNCTSPRTRPMLRAAVRDAREHDLDAEVAEQLPHEPDRLDCNGKSATAPMADTRGNGFPMNHTMLRAAVRQRLGRHDVARAHDRRAVRPDARSTSTAREQAIADADAVDRARVPRCTRRRSSPSCTTRST